MILSYILVYLYAKKLMKKDTFNLKELALEVINKEVKVINELPNYIDNNFINIINLLHNCKGRLIISGIGKSAIIAQKIVATMNSTGTPAIFMHAADAVHGDLGVVQKDDIVILISKSGNTSEIKRLIPFIKGMGNTIVAIIANKDSYLASHSDYILYTPVKEEACQNNLAPTSSTTVQMVMGDIISVLLSTMRHFTPEDFARYHPGGSLGKRLYMTVEDVFDSTNRPKVSPNDNVQDVIVNISHHRLGATVVTDLQDNLMGIITDGDVRRMIERGLPIDSLKAIDIMSKGPKTIDVSAQAVQAFNLMEKYQITSVVVLSKGTYVGLIHIHDILREGIG